MKKYALKALKVVCGAYIFWMMVVEITDIAPLYIHLVIVLLFIGAIKILLWKPQPHSYFFEPFNRPETRRGLFEDAGAHDQ